MRKLGFTFIALLIGLLVSGVNVAAAEHPAEKIVKSASNGILAQLRKERDVVNKDPNRVFDLVNEIVLPHFDFTRMSSSVLGKHWKNANDTQKKSFSDAFQILLVRTYAKALVDNMDKEIDFLPTQEKDEGKKVKVQTEIPQQGGFPLPINYNMYVTDQTWKVYDVNIDGISLVMNYRSTFSNEIKKDGLDNLIKKLSERNKQAAVE